MSDVANVRNLTKEFGSVKALDRVDLTVEKGEVHGFIGPNGAGKTTTIRCMLGILKPTKGHVKVFGLDAWDDSVEILKRVAFVPGDVNLWDNLTGGEVIDLFLALHGTTDTVRRDELIERFDLDPSKKCGTYSKGNRQKVALVAALASDGDFYILDEPTSGLDPLMGSVFKSYILELKREGKTVLLSSHILSEVEELCDVISIIRGGRIIETGNLAEMRHFKRTRVHVETARPIEGIEALEGIYDLSSDGTSYEFHADNDALGVLISHIDKFGITNLISAPPSLEELFMTHYEEVGD